MNLATRHTGRGLAPLAFLILLAGLVALVAAGASEAKPGAGKSGKPKVKVQIKTKSQASLLDKGKLAVKVKVKGGKVKGKTKLTAKSGKGKNFKPAKIKGAKGGKATLKLTKAGAENLATCGSKKVKVTATFGVPGSKKKGKSKGKATLKSDPSRCEQPYTPVPVENADRCDFLDPAVCLQPWPNDYFTVNDSSTATGKRLNLNSASMPANVNGVHIDPTDMNRADGFSPGNLIVIKIPGLETPAAFANSGIVPIDDMHAYADPDQAVMVINADTGERQPIWAELDSNPTTVDPDGSDPGGINANPSNTGDVNLIIRPAKNFDFGERYIVALRNLKDASNQPIQAPIGFQVYRDNEITDQPEVESRRPHMESIINDLTSKAGVDRNSLYMAWDFTVASEDSVTGRATTIRDDAFARLGDTDLADRKIDGLSPDWTITRVLNQGDPIPRESEAFPHRSHVAWRGRSRCPATSIRTGARRVPSSPTTPTATSPGIRATRATSSGAVRSRTRWWPVGPSTPPASAPTATGSSAAPISSPARGSSRRTRTRSTARWTGRASPSRTSRRSSRRCRTCPTSTRSPTACSRGS